MHLDSKEPDADNSTVFGGKHIHTHEELETQLEYTRAHIRPLIPTRPLNLSPLNLSPLNLKEVHRRISCTPHRIRYEPAAELRSEPSPDDPKNILRSSSQLIDEHLQEIQVRSDGHAKAALRYEKRDRILGYPVTLFSSFLASTLMMGLTQTKENDRTVINSVSLCLSIVSFVLSLSRDYLKYTTLFQAHDISSKLYTNLLRSIEVRLIGNHITPDDRRDMFKDIIDQMSIIEQYELAIPGDINLAIRSKAVVPRSVVINETLRQEEQTNKK